MAPPAAPGPRFFSFFPHACTARSINTPCGFTLCGNLNISYPFRLKTQPRRCGHKGFELVCDNNRAIFTKERGSFYVQRISYVNQTIHLVDVNLYKDSCSLPLSSLPFYTSSIRIGTSEYKYYSESSDIYVVNCSVKMNNSWSGVDYINASRCPSSPPTNNNYFYFLGGGTPPSAFHPSCTVEALVPIGVDDISGLSTFDIYQKLMMGARVPWIVLHALPDWISVINV